MTVGCHVCFVHIWMHLKCGDICENSLRLFSSALPNFTACPSQAGPSLPLTSLIACLPRSVLRGETADHTRRHQRGNAEPLQAAEPAKSSQKLCIVHGHKHRCAHRDLACSMYLNTHTHTHRLFPSFHYNLCFG